MEFVVQNSNDNDESNYFESNAGPHIVTFGVAESLWHDIDIQIIKIESLLISSSNEKQQSRSKLLQDPFEFEEEKSIDLNIEDDIDKLPHRLQSIYDKIDKLQQNNNNNLDDVEATKMKQRYESMIALNNIKFQTYKQKLRN